MDIYTHSMLGHFSCNIVAKEVVVGDRNKGVRDVGKKVSLSDTDNVPTVLFSSIPEQVQLRSKAIYIDVDNVKNSREGQFGMTVSCWVY